MSKCNDCGKDASFGTHLMCQPCKDKHEENLFLPPPLNEDCPICFLTLPSMNTGRKYQTCCGKMICSGCIHAVDKMSDDVKCPFCRVPTPISDEEIIEMTKKRVDMDDAQAIHSFGCFYYHEEYGMPQDDTKALEFWHRAGKLGSAESYHNIAIAYYYGRGAAKDEEKAKHYFELAAIRGNVPSRYNLGILERREGNTNRALKHYMIAAGFGDNDSLKKIREFYVNVDATKDDYALRYQKYVDGIKSAQRDEAAAFDSDEYRYY